MTKKLLQNLVGIIIITVLSFGGILYVAPVAKVSAAARDCDANAVIYCGVAGLSELIVKYRQNQGGNLQAIFAHFGMADESYFDGMMVGSITKNGEVYVGNELVATNAITAGRQNMPGSTKIPGIEAYERTPSVSFRSNKLDALIKMNQGTFAGAVILSCGNPVKATPVTKPTPPPPPPPAPKPTPTPQPKPVPRTPKLSIKKEVRLSGDEQWSKKVKANPNDELEYRITVANIGDVDLQNLLIQDSLPSEVSFTDSNLSLLIADSHNYKISDLIGNGLSIASLAQNEKIEIIFSVMVSSSAEACKVPFKNIVYASADNVKKQQDYALALVCQPQKPVEIVKVVQSQPPPPAPLPATGPKGSLAIFSGISVLGVAVHKLKELFLYLLR